MEDKVKDIQGKSNKSKEEIKAEQEKVKAEQEKAKAEKEKQKAEQAKVKAEQDKVKAEQDKAEKEKLKAEKEKQKAEQAELKAEQAKKKAEQNKVKAEKKKAEQEKKKAEKEKKKAEKAKLKAEKEKLNPDKAKSKSDSKGEKLGIKDKINNMKVKARLKLSFVFVVALASVAGLVAIVALLILNAQYSAALEENGFAQGDIGQYNTYLYQNASLMNDAILLSNEEDINETLEKVKEIDVNIEATLAKVKENCTTDEELEYINIMETQYPDYMRFRANAEKMTLEEDDKLAFIALNQAATPVMERVMKAGNNLANLKVQQGDEIASTLELLSTVMVIVCLIIIVAAVAFSYGFAVFTANSFAGPLAEVQSASQKLSEGELDVTVNVNTQNELGDMAENFKTAVNMLRTYIVEIKRVLGEVASGNFNVNAQVEFKGDFVEFEEAINQIVVALSDTMRQINEGAEQVALGAQQMAVNAQTLSDGATSQAGAVEELTATIENVAEAAEDSAEKTDTAYKKAQEFVVVAEGSSKEMEKLTEAMERITVTSKQIESIIAGIEDIASQTNLLSLNASIEAARAGEAGRGFAVVASQIGKLALDSAQSAVNTRELIGKALIEVKNGNEITKHTAESLEKVINGIKLLADTSHDTSTLSATQAETMGQVKMGIEQISEVVQNNSASAEETSATSEELLAQSESLKALVEQFKLRA